MPISMNPSARYVTQANLFSGNIVLRPLSDRRIRYYQERGRYGPFKPQLKRKRVPSVLAALLKQYE